MSVETVGAGRFAALRAELVGVYEDVFTRAPWHESHADVRAFGARLAGEAARPGFRAAVARDDTGTLVGFAYGCPTGVPFPTGRGYDSARRAVGDTGAAALCGRFEVVELAVRPGAQGAGHGRRLLAAVVADRPAWLLTAEFAPRAVAFYEARGWLRLGTADRVVVYAWGPTA